jgi:hypothetical protein
MVIATLDARGRLVHFRAVPSQVDEAKGPWPEPDWESLFREAGLDPKRFTLSSPKWLPPEAFDARAEWDGSFAAHPDVPIHVAAAAYHGKPVYFAVLGPWERPTRMQAVPRAPGQIASEATVMVVTLLLLFGSLVLARRNLRLGRGDRSGAFRVASVVFAANTLAWLLSAHHVPELEGEFEMFVVSCSFALFLSTLLWLEYIALEPFARRRWPDLLISWNRLLSGRFADPLVGRDILVGSLMGAAAMLIWFVQFSVPAWANVSGVTSLYLRSEALGSPYTFASEIVSCFGNVSAIPTFAIVTVLVLLSVLLGKRWLALGVTTLLMTGVNLNGENIAVDLPASLLVSALLVFVAARFGMLALWANFVITFLLFSSPNTLDFSRWYAGRSLVVLLIVVGLAFYGFWTSLGGKSPFGAAALEEA